MIEVKDIPFILTVLAIIVSLTATISNLRANRKKSIKEFQDKREARKNEKN